MNDFDWGRTFGRFFIKIKGREGTYCSNCIRELARFEQKEKKCVELLQQWRS